MKRRSADPFERNDDGGTLLPEHVTDEGRELGEKRAWARSQSEGA